MAAAEPLVISGCRLFDGVEPTTTEAVTLVLAGDEIAWVGPEADAPPVGDEARVLRAEGLTAMPGLIDMHTRSDGLGELTRYVRGGVTTLRFAGLDEPSVERARAAAASHPHVTPRILSCGPLLDAAPANWPQWTTLLDSPQDAARVGEQLAASGRVDALIAAQNVDAALLRPLVAAAHAHDLPVVGQTWALDGAQAAQLGIDQLDNTSRLFSSSLWPRRGPDTFKRVEDRIECWVRGWSSVDWDATMRIVDTMVEREVAHCPTLTAHYWWTDLCRHELEQDPLFRATQPSEQLTPNQRTLAEVERTWTRELKMLMRAALSNREEWLRRFHAAGGRVVAGTDTRYGGVMLHSELRWLSDAGLPADAIVRAATSTAADVLRRPDLGRLRPGCRADVLLVDGDPCEEISAARRIRAVVRGGRIAIEQPLAAAVSEATGAA
ncbi:MAG TPA: amidohydrolase family protein [Conexibacter sp.]|nr:amidohydrolase family protein [Conexibacter sp.]